MIPAGGDRADVVFTFAFGTWKVAAERGWFMADDRLALSLMESHRVRKLLVCDRFKSRLTRLVPRRVRDGGTPFPGDGRRHHVQPLRLRRGDPTGPVSTVARMGGSYERILRRAAERRGLEEPAVVTANPFVAGFGDFAWARSVTYHAMDDWAVHPTYRRWWPAYEAAYRGMRERARRVVAVSHGILEHIEPTGAGAVIPNGIEPSEWTDPAPPKPSAESDGPLLLYVGALGSRLDTEALLRLSAELPGARILLVGPEAEPRHVAPLRGAPNIEVRPPLGRAALARLVRSADVGLVPHVRSPLTVTMSPLKVFEYLAGGLPVAAIDLPPMRGIDDRVILAPEPDDLVEAVRVALALGRASEAERLRFVGANSWRVRHERLLDVALAGQLVPTTGS